MIRCHLMGGYMSRRKPLSCQSRKVCIVIRKNKSISLDKLKEYCFTFFDKYAFIEHTKDVDSTTGVVIPVHYHIVGDYKDSKVAFSTRLNQICTFFKFDNAVGIEIDQYNSLESSIQYLTHKNQSEKTPHNKSEIIHNFDQSDFDVMYNAESGELITIEFLFVACVECNNMIDVIKKIGLSNYRTWRNVVWDIWKTINNDSSCIKQ